MPPRKKSSTPVKKPTAKKSATKKPTTTLKAKAKSSTKKPKRKVLSPEEMHPFPTFPYRLEYQDGNDTRVCHFECEEHRDKHIKRYKLRKGKYFIDNFT